MNGHSPDDLGRLLDGSPARGDDVDRSRTVLWQMAAAGAVAAAVVLALAIARIVMPSPPPVVGEPATRPTPAAEARAPALTGLSVRDRGGVVGLRSDGSLAGLDGVALDVREAVAVALRVGRLPAPAARLAAPAGVAAASDLAAAVIAADAGLYQDADAALARLAAANPTSATVETLRRELAARKRAR